MYVKITNGAVDQYPYTVGNLRRDNPNTSFPRNISADTLVDRGLYPVTKKDKPIYDERTQEVELDSSPVLEGSSWVLDWTISSKSVEEIQQYDDIVAQRNRNLRVDFLSQTDWWALPDSPTMTAEQTAYRQALRDITSHANWPNLDEADWPTKP